MLGDFARIRLALQTVRSGIDDPLLISELGEADAALNRIQAKIEAVRDEIAEVADGEPTAGATSLSDPHSTKTKIE